MNSAHSSFVSVGGVSKLLSMSRCSRLSRKSWHTLSALSIILERTTGLDRCLLGFLWSERGARKWRLSLFSYTEYEHRDVRGAHTLNAVARLLSLNTLLLLRNVLQKTDAGCSPVVLYTNDTEGNTQWKYEWNHRDGGNTCILYIVMGNNRVRSDQWKHASHPVHKVCNSGERRCLGRLNQTSAGSSGSRTTPPDKADSGMLVWQESTVNERGDKSYCKCAVPWWQSCLLLQND